MQTLSEMADPIIGVGLELKRAGGSGGGKQM